MVSPDLVAQAREWLDRVDAGRGLSGNWRVEVVQKRYRKNRTGDETECTDLPIRIRRFLPGCPWALVAAVIRELVSRAPYSDIVCNGVVFSGRYRPTLTRWERDEQRSVDEQRGANGTYTLVQDLIEDSECAGALSVGSQASCQYEETTEYHWDEASVDFDLPDCGPGDCSGTPGCQGVTHALGAVSRNEDGSYNYQIVKRTARTVHTPETEVRCASCGVGRMTRESWDNVYGQPGAFRHDCGTPVVLPVCAKGKQVQLDIRLNADCTYRIEAVAEYAPAPESYGWTDGSSCRPRSVEVRTGDLSAPSVSPGDDGETVSATIERRPDCTFNSRIERVRPAAGVLYSWTDNTSCRPRYTTVYQDYRSIPSVPSVGDGQRLDASISRNSDCTWDARFSTLSAPPSLTDSWTVGSLYRPVSVSYYKDLKSRPAVPSVGVGRSVDASFSYSDDCLWSGTVRTDSPKATQWGWTSGTACSRTSVTAFRDQPSIPSYIVQPSVPGVEAVAQVDLSESGLYSGRFSETRSTDWNTKFTDGSMLYTNSTTLFRGAAQIPPATAPAVGVTTSYRVDRASDCTYSGSVTVRKANPVTFGWEEGSACAPVTVTVGRNQNSVPSGIAPAGSVSSISASVNEDGTFDWRRSVRSSGRGSMASWSEGSFRARTVTRAYYGVPTLPSVESPRVGTTVSANFSYSSGDCAYTGTVSSTNRTSSSFSWTEGNGCEQTNRRVVWGSATSPNLPKPSDQLTVQGSVSSNADGTWDYSTAETPVPPYETESIEWDSTEKAPNSELKYNHKVIIFRYAKLEQVQSLVKGMKGNIGLSFGFDRFCRLSGQVTSSELTEWSFNKSTDGGYREGTYHFYLYRQSPDGRLWQKDVSVPTRVYVGTGNEGSRASDMANGISLEGLALPGGVFARGTPSYGKWEEVR